MGFNFSAGAIDYGLSFGISSKPLWILPIGLVFGVLYYVIFVFCIKKFNIPTPGRINEDENRHEEPSFRETVSGLSTKAKDIINAIGGKKNVEAVDACITRVRLSIKDDSKVNDEKLRKLEDGRRKSSNRCRNYSRSSCNSDEKDFKKIKSCIE